nr:uncharacterized protein LOC129274655 [Lytechinus pictus]
MNFKMKQVTALFVFLVLLCFCDSAYGKLMWRMKPGEIIALRGNLVMLNCFVNGRNVTNPGEHKFWWYRVDRNVVVSKNLMITAPDLDSDRYSVLLDKYRGVYSLVIRNVSEADGGLYQCLLRQSRNGPQDASDSASLTVLTPPTDGYKPCTMFTQSNIILSPQGNRALKCPKSTDSFWRSASSNVATNETVYHSWTANRQVLHAFFLQNKTTLLSESSTTGSGNQDTVYCAVNSSMLQQFPNRCKLIPRATSTKATITPPITDVPNGSNVNFTCSHEDIAVAIDYTWDIPVELEVAGIQFMRNGRTIILKSIRGNWGEMLNIVCQVTTEWNVKANATATIAFLHKMITTPIVNAIAKGEIGKKPDVVLPPVVPDEAQRPSKSGNPALKNISILIGPALGVIILFLLAVIFALCMTKRKTSSKHQFRLNHQIAPSVEHHKAVTLRSNGKPSNRNSRSSRRFSDSFTYRFSKDCEYENIEAYMAKKGQFLGGTTSFQDENNQPMEANVRVKIEMPNNLSTSMPALNACKISSNINHHAAANGDQYQQQHYSNHQQHINHHPYKPLANGNPYATREQLGFPSLISQELRDTQHYHVPTTTATLPHAVIDRSKKAMKPPNPPPRKPSY